MHSTSGAPSSRRTHCSHCGTRKAKRWGDGRVTLTKFCPNDSCTLFGLPHLVAVATVVTIDRLGRRHIAHKEMATNRPSEPFSPEETPTPA